MPQPSRAGGGNTAIAHQSLSGMTLDTAFQPIVDLAQGEIAGFELLSRPASASGFDDAGQLFDWAENNKLLWPLEERARATGLDAAANWPEGVLLFLNTTPQVFADPRFAVTIAQAVQRIPGLTPSRIVLEITERSDEQHIDGLEQQVGLLKDAGFQIAIDDVGAGTSGLNRIMALRPNWLKLDRDLVERVDQDRARQNLLKFFLHFARLSGVKLVAEGIEREAELATLIDLGIPYGQGFVLGKPGARDQRLDPDLAEWLRSRWREADGSRVRDPDRLRVARYARAVETVPADRPARDVAAHLLRQLGSPGLAVIDGKRYVGWCDRDTALRAASDARAMQPIGFVVAHDPTAATTDTTVAEAIDLALCRDDRAITTPLVITDRGQITGVVTVRDLLHAATALVSQTQVRAAPVTGLPGRVRADEHLAELFAREHQRLATPRGSADKSFDAAIIDIRNFNDYNAVYGYELGDHLLKRLTGMIQQLIVRTDTDVFVGHLGDDRFLLTAPPKVLERRLSTLAQQFEKAVDEHWCDAEVCPVLPTSGPIADVPGFVHRGTLSVGLRAIVMPGVFAGASGVTGPRDLYRRAETLRSDAAGTTATRSVVIVDQGEVSETGMIARRLSA